VGDGESSEEESSEEEVIDLEVFIIILLKGFLISVQNSREED